MEQMRYKQEHKVDLMLGGILFLVFTSMLLALILFAGRGYEQISSRMEQTYGERTVLSYVANQIRQHDSAGAVSVESRDGISVLVLKEWIQGQEYQTMIYCQEGIVRELFARSDSDAALENGTEVLAVDSLVFLQQGARICVQVEAGGRETEAAFTLRSGTD